MRKRCPKCGGNILLRSDEHGWYENCLQCSYTHDLEPVVVMPRRQAGKPVLPRFRKAEVR